MGSTTPKLSEFLSTFEPVAAPRGPLMLASDGAQPSDAAFPMALHLSAHTGAPVQVVSTLMTHVMPTFAIDAMPVPTVPMNVLLDGRLEAIQGQMARLLPPSVTWPVSVRSGDAVREIVHQAREADARLIVTGRGKHGLLERVLGGETVLRLLQLGDTPVLAVSQEHHALPKRVVIATDFSVFSIYAAQVALELVSADAWVQFVHVAPSLDGTAPMLQEFASEYREQAARSFEELMSHLRRPGLTLSAQLLEGDAAAAIGQHAHAVDADLIVTATHGYGFLRRMVLGSVTAELVRTAPCSVLCVPGSARTLALARAQAIARHRQTRRLAAEHLDAELAAFSTRNRGRACTVEVRQRDIGVQPIGHHLAFAGASLDSPQGGIVLMFGDADHAHLSHQVRGREQVELIVDEEGRDQVLCITYDGGQTQIVFD
ncbi:MAG TPA: universal stress protein [Gemmatimonas sp.]|uniref:universal stress protein n=1 Tax=Gemmatimonas sp. TaxID=1962908 RepID=UPI002ED93A33